MGRLKRSTQNTREGGVKHDEEPAAGAAIIEATMGRDEKRRGLFSVHAAVFLFGVVGLFAKILPLPATILTLGRSFFSAVSLGLYLLIRKQNIRLHTTIDYCWLIGAGILLAVHWTSFMQSIQVSTVAIGTLTLATFPLVVAVLEPLLFHERTHLSDFACALVMLAGVGFIVPEFSLESSTVRGVLWGVLSAVTYALLGLANRRFTSTYSAPIVSFYEQTTAAIILLPFLFVLRPALSFPDIGLLAVMGVVFTALAHTLFIGGLHSVSVRTAGIVTGLESVYGVLAAWLLLGEMPGIRELTGGAIILGAVLYSTLKVSETPKSIACPTEATDGETMHV